MNRDNLKKGIQLFLTYFKIGCFTFGGGWAIVAQLEQEYVEKRKLISKSELLDLTTAGRSLPGIMAANMGMLFGYQIAGVFGGICAVVGISLPAIILLTLVTVLYDQLKDNQWCAFILRGIRAAVVPIVFSAAVSLSKDLFKKKSAVIIAALSLFILLVFKVNNITLIFSSILAAVIWMGVKKYVAH